MALQSSYMFMHALFIHVFIIYCASAAVLGCNCQRERESEQGILLLGRINLAQSVYFAIILNYDFFVLVCAWKKNKFVYKMILLL